MDPTKITKEQKSALVRVRVAEKIRLGFARGGERITDEEQRIYSNEPVPAAIVYDGLISYGMIKREERGNMVLTPLGREALGLK